MATAELELTEVKYPIADAKIAEWSAMYLPLAIGGIDDKENYQAVHNARMTVKNARIDIEKTRKQLKENVIKVGRTIDGEAKRLTDLLTPIEKHLEAEEDRIDAEKEAIKIAEENRKAAIVQARWEALAAVGDNANLANLAALDDAMFADRLKFATEKWDAEQKAKAEAEAEAERQRIEEEKRLAAERAKQERIRAEEDARRKAEAEALAKERESLAAERRKQEAEAEKLAEERRKITEQQEAQRRAENLARAIEVSAAQAREQEAARIEAERLAAEEKARQEAAEQERLKALQPDKEKLLAFANDVEEMELPRLSKNAAKTKAGVEKAMATAVAAIRKAANDLF